MQRVVEPITPQQRQVWGHHTVKMRHRMSEMSLFSDDSLAELIETVDPSHMIMHTMQNDLSTWKSVERGGVPGHAVLDAVRAGRIWINMVGIQDYDWRFRELMDQIFADWSADVPEFSTFKRKIGLLVSSPKARVFYHCDPAGQALWQVRGHKRIYLYPPAEPFLKAPELENVIRSATREEITYEPWFDQYAEVYELGPGDGLHWALNGPHRVDNHDDINVSLTSEHWTPQIRRSWAMNYGNGVLRSIGWAPRSRATDGAAFWAKVGVTAIWRKTMQEKQSYKRQPEYVPDPDAPYGVRPKSTESVGS